MIFQLLMRKLKKAFIKNTIEMLTFSVFLISNTTYFSVALFRSESMLLTLAASISLLSLFIGLSWMLIHLVLRLLYCSFH